MRKNEYGWIFSSDRVAHSGGGKPHKGYLPCGYMSCKLTAEQVEWAYNNLEDLSSLSELSYNGYSIDGDLLNRFIAGVGKVSI
jgi:hypothetical protein